MTTQDRGVCECGHVAADHLRGVGCCIADDPDDEVETCGCGVFSSDADGVTPHDWNVQITTPDGQGSFRVSAGPKASPEIRAALHALAEEAYRRFEGIP